MLKEETVHGCLLNRLLIDIFCLMLRDSRRLRTRLMQSCFYISV